MEIVGWITIILLCVLALTFIIIELGPMLHTEISSWKIRKQKALEAREDKSRYKQEMKDLKHKAKKLKYMKKHGLDTTELELGLQSPSIGENAEDVDEIENEESAIVEVDETDTSNSEISVESVEEETVTDTTKVEIPGSSVKVKSRRHR